MTAPLELLARGDKWYLSAGEGLVWAPPFPAWLERPGFWDEAHLFEYPLAPLFSVAFVDDAGREIPLEAQPRRWTPDVLVTPYRTPVGLQLVESRMVLPGFVLGSEWQIVNPGLTPVRVHVVAWTTAPGDEVEPGEVAFEDSELVWSRVLRDRRDHALAVRLQLAFARGTDTWGAVRAERTADQPTFRFTPFWDRWNPTQGGLRSAAELGGIGTAGLVYLGVHRVVELDPGGTARIAVALRAVPDLVESTLRVEAPAPPRASSFAAASRWAWEEYYRGVPTFRCSDPYFERYWAYRWYGLRLCGIAAGWGNYVAPTVCEGIGGFHMPITYSAQCHLRELRWAKDPEWARGVLRTFLAHQKPDGGFHGRIYANHLDGTDFYHADWGGALLAFDAVHPSDAFLREVLPGLEDYAGWLATTRDADGSGLVDVTDQYETGQEYMSRYQAVDEDADRYGWENRLRLKGVDVSVYAYRLYRALAQLAERAGTDPAPWLARAQKTGFAIQRRLWDGRAGVFSDLDPATGKRTGVKAAVSFYPYLTDLIGPMHLAGFVEHLFDPREFWKPFPVPSSSGKDPLYDPDAAWKGKRHNCPWNGRVWPMTNSHVADAIGNVAINHLPALRSYLVEFINKYVRMLFWDGDASRPNAFEHYHPVTGRPSAYRGIDDYQHSWVNDLIVQYVIGLRPLARGAFVVDPMPFVLDGFEATGLPMQGALVDVAREDEVIQVRIAGREAARGKVGTPIEVHL
jgi:hypothetical protein